MKTMLLTGCLFLACSAWGQTKRVSVTPPEQLHIKAGESRTQVTQVVVEPGSHVNNNKPRGEFLIPLQLEWQAGPLKVVSTRYPEAEELQVGPDRLLVYTGTFGIETVFQAPSNAPRGQMELKGKLHYQACNTQMCFRPATADVSLPVTIQ